MQESPNTVKKGTHSNLLPQRWRRGNADFIGLWWSRSDFHSFRRSGVWPEAGKLPCVQGLLIPHLLQFAYCPQIEGSVGGREEKIQKVMVNEGAGGDLRALTWASNAPRAQGKGGLHFLSVPPLSCAAIKSQARGTERPSSQ